MSYGGYTGYEITVDLTKESSKVQQIDFKVRKKYLGGIGTNTYCLYNELRNGANSLSPENVMIIGIGPLVGSGLPGTDRVEITSKSPLNEGIATANAGCYLGLGFKQAGFDQIILKGKAFRAAILYFHDKQVEFIDAEDIWGLKTSEAVNLIKKKIGDNSVHVLTIGPAGENLVRFANIQSDRYMSFSRGGLGAVMGSKNIKAIVVPSGEKYEAVVADQVMLENIKKDTYSRIQNDPLYDAMCKYGTMLFISKEVSLGKKVSAEYFYENYKVNSLGCYRCPMPCSHRVKVTTKEGKLLEFRGGEVSPVRAFAGPCKLQDFESILECSEESVELGLEMLSAGGVIGWLLTCCDKGLIEMTDIDGLEIKKGSKSIVLKLLEKIAYRKGIGDVLAEGVYRAAEIIGENTEKYQLSVKKVEFQVDPRPARPGIAWCFAQAVSARADAAKAHPLLEFSDSLPSQTFAHLYSMEKTKENIQKVADWMAIPNKEKKELFDNNEPIKWKTYNRKAKMVKWAEDLSSIIDSVGICKRYSMDLNVAIGIQHYVAMLNSVTGMDFSEQEIRQIGERIITLQRLFLQREIGIKRKDDTFPKIVFEEKLEDNPPYTRAEFEKMLDEYYMERNWDILKGLPTKESVERLSLVEEWERVFSPTA